MEKVGNYDNNADNDTREDKDIAAEGTAGINGSLSTTIPFAVADHSDQFYLDLFALYLASNLWTLLMTGIPLLANLGPDTYYPHHPGWYTGNDVARLLEPIGGFLYNFYIFKRSGIFLVSSTSTYKLTYAEPLIFIFFLGSAIYGQGAGFHSASNLFKNAFETILAIHNDDLGKDYEYWLRTVWEHETGHYLYAAGYAIMAFAQLWAYRSHCLSGGQKLSPMTRVVLVAAAILYGLLIAGVAIDFPSGVIVAFVYLILYGIFGVGGYLVYLRKTGIQNILTTGRRPVVQYFLLSYCVALFIVIIWTIIVGGAKDMSQAGY
jgi:hypothetical protein